MLKKQIVYTDYNGVERTENFYFNLSKAEIYEWEASESGGMSAVIAELSNTQNVPRLMVIFKDLIMRSVGIKSPDGKTFMKTDQIRNDFLHSEAYSVLFTELAASEANVAAFIQGIIPEGVKLNTPSQ